MKLSDNQFNPKNGNVYIKPVQTNKTQKNNYQQINNRKCKIKSANAQANKLLKMLISSYNNSFK